MPDIRKKIPKEKTMSFKISAEQEERMKKFCVERSWNLSAFIRVAIEESMERVVADEED